MQMVCLTLVEQRETISLMHSRAGLLPSSMPLSCDSVERDRERRSQTPRGCPRPAARLSPFRMEIDDRKNRAMGHGRTD